MNDPTINNTRTLQEAVIVLVTDRDQWKARAEAAEQDAARYRYLRQIDRVFAWEALLQSKPIWSCEAIDAAIDAAMKEQP